MPYRRLPNTESARYKALKTALDKGNNLPPYKLPYSQQSLKRLRSFFPEYERLFKQLEESRDYIKSKNKQYLVLQKRARLYLSHFIQVMNLSIARGDLKPAARTFYGIKENNAKIPRLVTEADLIKWGEKIINGEPERIAQGGNPVTNPTVAVVKVRYDQFIEAYRHQNTLKETYKWLSKKLSAMRKEADSIILSLWNELEEFYGNLPDNEKREKCKDFGIVYFLRSNEAQKTKSLIPPEYNEHEKKQPRKVKPQRKKETCDSQISLLFFKDEVY